MKLIHTADLHLGMEPDKGKPWSQSRGKELWKTFYRIVDVCREEKADLLLIAGDLFHRQPLVKEWKEVNRAFDTIPETTVVLIAGNHDYLSVRSCGLKLERADNLVLFQEEEWSRFCLEKFPAYLYGFSYHGRKVPERSITEVIPGTEEGYHILIAHGGEEGRLPVPERWIRSAPFDYVALGHIHKPALYGSKGGFCGSLEPLDSTETGPHGYIRAILEKGSSRVEFVPFALRRYEEVTVETDPEEGTEFLNRRIRQEIGRRGAENFFRIRLEGMRDPDCPIDCEAIRESGQIAEIEDLTIPDYDFERLAAENRDNLIGRYIQAVRKSGEEDEVADRALYLGMEVLLHANSR